MLERLEKLIADLQTKREAILDGYLHALEVYDQSRPNVTLEAVNKANLIHDIDRHITNLYAEIERVRACASKKTLLGSEATNG